MPIRKNSRKNSRRLSGRRRSGRKLSGGRVVRTGPNGGKYVLRAGRKVYLSGGAGCSRLRKDDCKDGCEWVVGKGCRSAAKKPAAKKPAANLSRLEEELLPAAKKKPAAKRSKGRAMSAREYVDAGGQEGAVCDIRNDGELKCLVYRKNGSPYWSPLDAPKAQAIVRCGQGLSCGKKKSEEQYLEEYLGDFLRRKH